MSIPAPDPTLAVPEDALSFEKATEVIRRRIGLAGPAARPEAATARGVIEARGRDQQDGPRG